MSPGWTQRKVVGAKGISKPKSLSWRQLRSSGRSQIDKLDKFLGHLPPDFFLEMIGLSHMIRTCPYNGLANSRFHTLLFGINRLRSDGMPYFGAHDPCSGAFVQLLCNQKCDGFQTVC